MTNLHSYFERIQHDGTVSCDLQTLRSIVFAHATSIPFEGLDPLAGVSVSLEHDAIFDKLVRRQRGGYCFEQNALLSWALRKVGFDVAELSARVWYNTPEGVTPPRTHIFLAVTIDGKRWLADCGVGGSTPTGLMELDRIGDEQNLLNETRRIVVIEGRHVPTFLHQVKQGDTWSDVYEFTGETMPKIDQEMGNWWTSRHPDSKFRKNVIVALLNRDGTRTSLVNNAFLHRRAEEILERIEIRSREQLDALLRERFGLDLPATADVRSLFV
ncbi:Arylamine N-acetyltransferase [Novipirellula aureliae]|uniref:Arylamine N-acetyltransferase n=1 Tax=Novipirellula aureliae TaxID=2527966 RepID=A0A5C6E6C7_9BACT|nr:arylamine N-acetyltransferase [Novipirellula aureliae]TWU43517.1 Arylamine N-acetyltransferase [Novipirellula aureliae]